MATQTTTRLTENKLVDKRELAFIRPINITVSVVDVKPNTKLYVYFDGVNVNEFCRQIAENKYYPVNGVDTPIGHPDLGPFVNIKSNANGVVKFVFSIPGKTFSTGTKEILVTDAPKYSDLKINGNVYGSASSKFSSKGIQEIWQKTTTTTIYNTVEIVVPRRSDPLAQSFFTYGQSGGVFVTSIDLYFQSKDATIPVRVELRKMENGFPSELDESNPDLVSTVLPQNVNISDNASAATRFTFPSPVYLPEDGDFCFVVFTNSKNYNIWTSKLGERSIENGQYIYGQPYVGSMFKSENNYTWTPEQTEDIKFTLNKAAFSTNTVSDITMIATTPQHSINGEYFVTTSGSPNVVFKSPVQHGLDTASLFAIKASELPNAKFNGITAANMSGEKTITNIIDDYTLEFVAGGNATVSGQILSSDIVTGITVVNGGSNYTTAPVVTLSAPDAGGTQATATALVFDGRIISITMTNNGTKYTSRPSVTITGGGGGSGAEVYATIDPIFNIALNQPYSMISPQVPNSVFAGTSLRTTLKPTTFGYGNGVDVDLPLDKITRLSTRHVLASRNNEASEMGNANSLEMLVEMSSSNPNVSPVIDLRKNPSLFLYNNAINAQTEYESVESTNKSATVSSVTVTAPGSGYTGTPTVTFTPAQNETSTTIVAPTVSSVTLSGNTITDIILATNGSGYTRPPIITISGTGSGAAAVANLSSFNSELNTAGTAYSRYFTKKIKLQEVSSDVRVLANIYSTPETSVDWYIRSSLSSDALNHEDAAWVKLKCDTPRDKSSLSGEYYEYEFYSDTLNLAPFDTYDLKCVLSSVNPAKTPYVKMYRVIAIV